MTQRVVTAALLLAVAIPLLFWGDVPAVQFLCALVVVGGTWEYGALRKPAATPQSRVFAAVLALLPIAAAGLPSRALAGAGPDVALLTALGIAVLAIPIQAVLRPNPLETAPARMAATLFGVLYLGFTLALGVRLRALPNGLTWLTLTLAAVWLGDTGAYLGGKALGRHKLHPAVSPNKTWEGTIAGLAASFATGFVVWLIVKNGGHWKGAPLKPVHVAIVSLLAGGMGQLGDLAESLLKRAAGVKDSGALLPGHGGVLDRIDALLFALPSVFFYVRLVFGARSGP